MSSVKLESGEVDATKRIGGNFSASPVSTDGKLYGINDDGEVIVLKADDSREELARNSFDGAIQAAASSLADGIFAQ